MVILQNGNDKKYYAKCHNCATEIEYELSDIKRERSMEYRGDIKTLTCPVCGETIQVSLLTKEEVEKAGHVPYFNSCCC